jgi:hypothetical protein
MLVFLKKDMNFQFCSIAHIKNLEYFQFFFLLLSLCDTSVDAVLYFTLFALCTSLDCGAALRRTKSLSFLIFLLARYIHAISIQGHSMPVFPDSTLWGLDRQYCVEDKEFVSNNGYCMGIFGISRNFHSIWKQIYFAEILLLKQLYFTKLAENQKIKWSFVLVFILSTKQCPLV